jgi:hypothetical protein
VEQLKEEYVKATGRGKSFDQQKMGQFESDLNRNDVYYIYNPEKII